MPTPTPMTPQEKQVAVALDKMGIEYEFTQPTPIEPLAKVIDELSNLVYEEWGHTPRAAYWLAQAEQYTTPTPELRTALVHLKLSALEKLELQRRAREAGQTMSDYARMRIFAS